MAENLLDMSLDAITDANKAARKSNPGKGSKGKGAKGRGKGRGGFAGRDRRGKGGGPIRQPRAYAARRSNPYGSGIRRTVVNDEFEEDNFYEDEDEEEYQEPVRGIQTKSARAASGLSTGTTVQVSNLHADVTDDDMQELFSNPIREGDAAVSLKSCCVNYDRQGKCNGTCTVVFSRKSDALAALEEYNGVPLDDHPMQLLMVGAPAAPVAARPAKPRVVYQQEERYQPSYRSDGPARGRGRSGKGKGKSKGRGRGAPARASTVTEEELDGGLNDYFNN